MIKKMMITADRHAPGEIIRDFQCKRYQGQQIHTNRGNIDKRHFLFRSIALPEANYSTENSYRNQIREKPQIEHQGFCVEVVKEEQPENSQDQGSGRHVAQEVGVRLDANP